MTAARLRWTLVACLALLAALAGTALGEAGESAVRPHQHAAIAAGGQHTCAIDVAGAVRCWGDDALGQLGDGPAAVGLPPAAVALGRPAIAVAAGDGHTCALLDDGAVRCWGLNVEGAVGSAALGGHAVPAPAVALGGPAAAVAAGGAHTCALLPDGSVRCWGANALGQLGGAAGPASAAPAAPVALGGPARALAAGTAHTCALLADGSVRCWGATSAGRLGDPDPNLQLSPAGLGAAVPLGGPARAISAGGQTTCALLADGAVRCWGSDLVGQLGDGGPLPGPPGAAPAPAVALGSPARAVTVGGFGACALLADDTVRCWGDDAEGQLGDGGPIPGAASSGPAGAVALGAPARAVTAGGRHVCALLAGGALRCWGADDAGELGDGPPTPSWSVPSGAVGLPPFAAVDGADVSLTAAASSATAQRGQPFTVTVTAANAGPDAADVTVRLALSSNVAPTSASPSQGSFASGARQWTVGTLAPGASATLTLTATAGPTTAAIAAEVLSSSARDPDSVLGGVADDRATVSVAIAAGPAPPPDDDPSPPGRARPGELTLRLVPARDPEAPFVFAARGGLIIPGAAARGACAGTVTVTVRRGQRPVRVRRVALRNRAGACGYSARLAFARRPAGARRLTVVARFAGNDLLTAKGSRKVTARLG